MPPTPPAITSRTNANVKALRAAFSGKASRAGEVVGIEGEKSVLEAWKAGLRFECLAFVSAPDVEEAYAGIVANVRPHVALTLTPEVMASVVDTGSSPAVAGSVMIPEKERQGPPSRIFLLLEEIQDPGNVGTLLRSAEAFGVERVYLSPGCANPWSPKVIRSSAGSIFRQPLRRQSMPAAIAELKSEGVRVLGAVARGRGASVSLAVDLASPIAFVIGNEGSGLSTEVLSSVEEKVYVPCLTESLNAAVAGSVLLYDALSQSVQRTAEAEKAAQRATGPHEPV